MLTTEEKAKLFDWLADHLQEAKILDRGSCDWIYPESCGPEGLAEIIAYMQKEDES